MQESQTVEPTRTQIERIRREKGDIAYWTDMAFLVEKVRVATQVRISHLAKTSRRSPDTEDFLKVAMDTESFVDKRLASYAITHPTWDWASPIKGIGKENYPKVLGLIEAFGRYYDVDDPWIPSFVTRQPESYQVIEHGDVVDKIGVWVEGIERLATPSKLWKYAGLSVDSETGKAPKRASGKLLSFNSELRMALYRLGTSLMRAKGIWYERYEQIRQEIIAKKEGQGIKFMATPKGRMCLNCNLEVNAKRTLFCPTCGERLTLKQEATGVMFLGHLHQMALREMIKEFLVCMWLVWRQELGLPITQPYKVERLDHKPIDPWKMVDKGSKHGNPEQLEDADAEVINLRTELWEQLTGKDGLDWVEATAINFLGGRKVEDLTRDELKEKLTVALDMVSSRPINSKQPPLV